jgi:hypothetical protein
VCNLRIRSPKKKVALKNDKEVHDCSACYDGGHYSEIDFLYAVNHSAKSVLTSLDANEIISDFQ